MPMDRFFIAPYDLESGQQTNVRPWLIPDTAFESLRNAYVFRGRVRKRFGSKWLGNTQQSSRLRVLVDTVDGGGTASGTVPSGSGAIGQAFSIGTNFFTVNALGTPANLLVSGSASTAQFNTTSGAFVFTGVPAGADVYWYPALPVMGLLTFETVNANNEFSIAFDTKYAYQYQAGDGWQRLDSELTAGAATWTGSDSQFFWGTTWTGTGGFEKVFFVTNFNESEPNFMRYFFQGQWQNFRPAIDGSSFLNSALIVVPFKNRLVYLNTWEGASSPGDNYQNRARYSQVGSPLAVDAFRQDQPGKGNAIDAATTEAIISAEFIKDRLIVYFERSTWELAYTGNQAYPFTWQQINTELGAESTFSIVPFDKVALGVGNVGIVACNGSNVERIDDKIPDTVFSISNLDEGPNRVYGIRDYFVEMVYWTLPNSIATTTMPYPNKVLVYNYKNNTWGINDDSITAFGYFQPRDGVNWNSRTITWDDPVPWDGGSVERLFRAVIGGNQEGYTFLCDTETTTNAPALQITDISITNNVVTFTVINHNLRIQDYVYLQGITGTGNITLLNHLIIEVQNGSSSPNTFTYVFDDNMGTVLAGVYSGGGVISRVSEIVIRTKQYNFYAEKGRNAYVAKVDFMVDNNSILNTEGAIVSGMQLQANFYASTNIQNLLTSASSTGTLLGSGTLDAYAYESIPFERDAQRLWHPVYLQAEGEVVQLELRMSPEQLKTVIAITADGITSYTGPTFKDFQLHAMVFHAQSTSYHFR